VHQLLPSMDGVGMTLRLDWLEHRVIHTEESIWCVPKAALLLLAVSAFLWAGIILLFRYLLSLLA
jgi:hypothetical protein